MAKKLTNEEFINKCKNIHGDKFDYTKTEYVNVRTKIIIICKEHGEFNITPDNHLGKQQQGCSLCARSNHKLTEISSERLKLFKEIHNNKYTYEDLSVTDGKINIICPIHGIFNQIIHNHEKGHGCGICFGSYKLTKISNERLNKLKLLHNNKYEYKDLSVNNGYINIICPTHGEFIQNIHLHENGSECRKCSLIKRGNKAKEFNLSNPKNPIIDEKKACIDCGEVKSIKSFPLRDKNDINSHRNQCANCFRNISVISNRKYKKENKKEIRRKDLIYRKNRMVSNPLYKAKIIARNVIRKSLTKCGYTKNSRTFDILGCSYEEFKIHLESQFTTGMDWLNRHMWDIDHIIPLDFCKTEEECLKLNNYKNLRPIWRIDNQEKSNFITEKTEIYKDIINKRI